MTKHLAGRINVRGINSAVVALAASTAMLAFVVVLPPGAGEIAVASASVGAVHSDAPAPPPLPPGLPGPVAQDYATVMQVLQNLPANGDDATSGDDDGDVDTTAQQGDQQLQDQLNQNQSDQQQNQLNSDQMVQQQNLLNSEQLSQEQNDQAQQQVDEGLQQAQQDEIDANQ